MNSALPHTEAICPGFRPAEVCALVLNWRNTPDTLACLAALTGLKERPLGIVVVDNGSGPKAASELEAASALAQGWAGLWQKQGWQAPCVCREGEPLPEGRDCLLLLDDNRGFAGGNNAALRAILRWKTCRAVWLLNNDTLPEPEALAALCAALNAQPKAGLCGSTMRYAHAPDRVQCSGGGWLNRWLGTTRLASDGLGWARLPQENIRPLDFVLGASCLVRREVFARCGLLPEEYFLYYEEVDFALRAKRQGFGCLWARASRVLHREGASTRARGSGTRAVSRPAWVDWLMVRNRLYLMRRHFPLRLPVAVLGLLAMCGNRLRRGQAGRIPGLLLAAWHGLCGKMGRPAEGVR